MWDDDVSFCSAPLLRFLFEVFASSASACGEVEGGYNSLAFNEEAPIFVGGLPRVARMRECSLRRYCMMEYECRVYDKGDISELFLAEAAELVVFVGKRCRSTGQFQLLELRRGIVCTPAGHRSKSLKLHVRQLKICATRSPCPRRMLYGLH